MISQTNLSQHNRRIFVAELSGRGHKVNAPIPALKNAKLLTEFSDWNRTLRIQPEDGCYTHSTRKMISPDAARTCSGDI